MARVLPILALSAMLSFSCQGVATAQPTKQRDLADVLGKLAQYDSIFMSGFAVSATQQRMDRIDANGPFFKVNARWRLTTEGNRLGYFVEAKDYENPTYLPPDKRVWAHRYGQFKAALQEKMFATVRIQEWGYWGEEACGVHQVDRTLTVSPDGATTEAGTMYNSRLFSPRDISLIAWPRNFQWGLGRFFGKRLHKVIEVKESKDGRLHVTALGDLFKGENGTWRLDIEPNAAWMVRQARFHPESRPTQINAEMINEGTMWNGSFCIPKTARVNFFGPIEDMQTIRKTTTQHLVFESKVNTFDDALYRRCQQLVLHDDHGDLTVTDGRMSPPSITQPNRPQPAKVSPAPAARRPFRRWTVICSSVIAIVVMAGVLVLRRRRHGLNRTVSPATG